MAQELIPDVSATKTILRILRKHVRSAHDGVRDLQSTGGSAVHDARKDLKIARAMLRLLRPALCGKTYRQQNHQLRDAARPLTTARDAEVLPQTLAKLTEDRSPEISAADLEEIRRKFLLSSEATFRRALQDLGSSRELLNASLKQAHGWPLKHRGWSVLGPGIERVYRQGREAHGLAAQNRSADNFHQWRKQAKYLRHQLEVLRPVWPLIVGDLADKAHELADLLGDDRDLYLLRQQLDEVQRCPARDTAAILQALIDARRRKLQDRAFELGMNLYEQRAQFFAARLKACWHCWKRAARQDTET
jgi:CHAD domain-containing protein